MGCRELTTRLIGIAVLGSLAVVPIGVGSNRVAFSVAWYMWKVLLSRWKSLPVFGLMYQYHSCLVCNCAIVHFPSGCLSFLIFPLVLRWDWSASLHAFHAFGPGRGCLGHLWVVCLGFSAVLEFLPPKAYSVM